MYEQTPRQQQRELLRIRTRLRLMQILGSRKCFRCGFNDFRALQFDHINGGGCKEIKYWKSGSAMLRYYSKNPEEARAILQVLCANCNWIKRAENGECANIV